MISTLSSRGVAFAAIILNLGLALGTAACNSTDGGGQVLSLTTTDGTTRIEPVPTSSASPAPTTTPTGTPTDVSGLYSGPAEVAPFVQKFVDDAKAQGVDVTPDMSNPTLTIQIASLDSYGSSVIGLCETGGGQRKVTFDPDFWNSVSDTQKELLAHHELGHCVLYRAHKTSLLDTGAYASIMYPIIMSSSTYTSNYAYYQQELFSLSALEALDPSAVVTHICNVEEILGTTGTN